MQTCKLLALDAAGAAFVGHAGRSRGYPLASKGQKARPDTGRSKSLGPMARCASKAWL